MARSTFKVLFYVNGSKEKNGLVPIMGRVTINGTVAQFSCKQSILKTLWDVKGNKAKGKSHEARDINLALDNIKAQIIKHYQRISDREAFVTAEMVRNAYQGIGSEYETLLKAFDKENEAFKKRVGKDRVLSTYRTRVRARNHVAAFIKSFYRRSDMSMLELTPDFIKEVPVVQRLELLNGIIKDDFADRILMDTLNSKERIDLHLHPELEQELQQRQQQDEERLLPLEEDETVRRDVLQGDAMVRGEDLALLNENKGWYREGAHGREVEVGDIMVEKVPQTEGEKKSEDKYRMTAIINGEAITHEIKQKDYDKFLAVDDYHRMKLFSKVFSEVDMKTRPEANAGLGTKILAALTAGAVVTAEVAHDINHHHHHPAPELYAEHHGGPRPYFKPGVDSPQEIAARYFEAEANQVATEIRRGY